VSVAWPSEVAETLIEIAWVEGPPRGAEEGEEPVLAAVHGDYAAAGEAIENLLSLMDYDLERILDDGRGHYLFALKYDSEDQAWRTARKIAFESQDDAAARLA
jgi:hypothetical protein